MGGGQSSQRHLDVNGKAGETDVADDSIENRLNKAKPPYYTNVRLSEDDIRLAKLAWGCIMSAENTIPFQKRKNDEGNFRSRTSLSWFYEEFLAEFFRTCPSASSYANADVVVSGKLVAGLLTTVLKYVDDPENLRHQLVNNATNYSHKGVKSEHYSPMGSAMISALEKVVGPSNESGPSFDEPTKAAWYKVYSSMLDIMLPVAVQYEIDQETSTSGPGPWSRQSVSNNSPRRRASEAPASKPRPTLGLMMRQRSDLSADTVKPSEDTVRENTGLKPPARMRKRSTKESVKPSDQTMRVNMGLHSRPVTMRAKSSRLSEVDESDDDKASNVSGVDDGDANDNEHAQDPEPDGNAPPKVDYNEEKGTPVKCQPLDQLMRSDSDVKEKVRRDSDVKEVRETPARRTSVHLPLKVDEIDEIKDPKVPAVHVPAKVEETDEKERDDPPLSHQGAIDTIASMLSIGHHHSEEGTPKRSSVLASVHSVGAHGHGHGQGQGHSHGHDAHPQRRVSTMDAISSLLTGHFREDDPSLKSNGIVPSEHVEGHHPQRRVSTMDAISSLLSGKHHNDEAVGSSSKQQRASIVSSLAEAKHEDGEHQPRRSIVRVKSQKVVLKPTDSDIRLYTADSAVDAPDDDPTTVHRQFSDFSLEPKA